LVKRGATSFHCSEEIWSDPLKIVTGMQEKQLNEIRIGWDLLIDIDSKYIDYSKVMAKIIINFLKFHGVKNVGIKFSGSKGFHLIIPWKAFPKQFQEVNSSDKFPEFPRIITKYIMEKTKNQLVEQISALERPSKYVKDYRASKEVMPDLILVSPRHLFRMPYSLHEKTALASIVLTEQELEEFDLNKADPLKLPIEKIRNFTPNSREGEASELLMQALDWWRENCPDESNNLNSSSNSTNLKKEFSPIKLTNLSDSNFPPCVKNILKGIGDGKKRAIFVLINLFRSIGMDRVELEQRIYEWNKKNEVPLKEGYIKSQLSWSYRKNPILPQNCKEFYQGIAVCVPDDSCKFVKNPLNYTIKKNFQANSKSSNNSNDSTKLNKPKNKSPKPKNKNS
jgi:hypothetical protein